MTMKVSDIHTCGTVHIPMSCLRTEARTSSECFRSTTSWKRSAGIGHCSGASFAANSAARAREVCNRRFMPD